MRAYPGGCTPIDRSWISRWAMHNVGYSGITVLLKLMISNISMYYIKLYLHGIFSLFYPPHSQTVITKNPFLINIILGALVYALCTESLYRSYFDDGCPWRLTIQSYDTRIHALSYDFWSSQMKSWFLAETGHRVIHSRTVFARLVSLPPWLPVEALALALSRYVTNSILVTTTKVFRRYLVNIVTKVY